MAVLHVLHLEDDPLDAELVREALAADGLFPLITRVDNREAFSAALAGQVDVVLADYVVPGFDGLQAQALVLAQRPDVPFIFVSGTLGEEVAVERIKAGARDYVLKDRLVRLPSSIRRALDEARAHADREGAQRALERLNVELEERICARTSELAQKNAALVEAEEGLREARAFLEDLLAASPSMVFRLDAATLRLTYVSPNVGWLLGYGQDELVDGSLRWPDLVHEEDRPGLVAAIDEALGRQAIELRHEWRLRGKNGTYRWAFCLLRIAYGPDDKPEAILGYALDIAERKAAEQALRQSEERLSAIFATVAEGIIIVSDDGALTFWNPAAERMLGRTDGEISRSPLDPANWVVRDPAGNLLPLDQWPASRAFAAGRPVAQEISVERPGAEPVQLAVCAAPLRDPLGMTTAVLTSFRDITERVRAEQALKEARDEADRANRAKSAFLSRMSHDLRTPLNSVIGFAQLLEADAGPGQEAAGHILGAGRHLLELINEVLDIARIEAGHLSLSPEPVSIEDVVDAATAIIRPLADKFSVQVVFAAPPSDRFWYVTADRQRLQQVLLNLLGNAVKYNRAGGQVHVQCEHIRDGWTRISVSDTGAGIPEAKLPLLFRQFERLGAEASSVEGTGLGLALVKALVEAMGGTVGVRSVVDQGSTFWIDLPSAAAPTARPASSRKGLGSVDPATRGTVLYIEDNAANARLMERLLGRRPGVRLIWADSGSAGIEYARTESPDLVLLDLHLPDMPGTEVSRRLWADPRTRRIPVAVLSADAMPSQVRRQLEEGVLAYLTKPLDIAALLRLVDETLNQASAPL